MLEKANSHPDRSEGSARILRYAQNDMDLKSTISLDVGKVA